MIIVKYHKLYKLVSQKYIWHNLNLTVVVSKMSSKQGMTMTEVKKELTYPKDNSQYSKSPQRRAFKLLLNMNLNIFIFTLDIPFLK